MSLVEENKTHFQWIAHSRNITVCFLIQIAGSEASQNHPASDVTDQSFVFSTEPHQTYLLYLFIRWNQWGFGCINAFRLWVSGEGFSFFLTLQIQDRLTERQQKHDQNEGQPFICPMQFVHYPLGQAPCGRLFVVKILGRLKFGGKKNYHEGQSQPVLEKTACGLCVSENQFHALGLVRERGS